MMLNLYETSSLKCAVGSLKKKQKNKRRGKKYATCVTRKQKNKKRDLLYKFIKC